MPLDVTEYVDLTLDDRDPQDLIDIAVAQYAILLPDLELKEGHTEAVLIESFALMLAELIFAANRLPGATVEVLLRLLGLNRDPGAFPTTTLAVTTNGAYRVEAPPGTRVRLELPDGLPVMVLATTEPIVVEQGDTSGLVTAAGVEPRADGNSTPAGTAVDLLDQVVGVETVTLHTPLTGGRDPEDSAAFLRRGSVRLARLTDTLVRPSHFTAAALEDPRVGRAYTIDMYDPTAGSGDPGDHPGNVTVAMLDPDGVNLDAGAKTEIVAMLEAQAVANLTVHAADPTVTDVDVTVTVRGRPGFTESQVQAAVVEAVGDILSPLTWPFEPTVFRFALVAAVDRVASVARVEQVLLDGVEDDAALPGVAPLAAAGTVAVTVNF